MSPSNIESEEMAIPKRERSKVFFKLRGLNIVYEDREFVQLVTVEFFLNLFNGSATA